MHIHINLLYGTSVACLSMQDQHALLGQPHYYLYKGLSEPNTAVTKVLLFKSDNNYYNNEMKLNIILILAIVICNVVANCPSEPKGEYYNSV